MLLAADGAVVSAEELLEHVWDAIPTRQQHRLGDDDPAGGASFDDPPLIETVVGKGYRM